MIYDQAIAQQLEDLLTKALVARLKAQGHTATGKGVNSIKTQIRETSGGLIMSIYGEDYLEFQETGRKAGKLPNIGALESWVKRKGIASEAKEVKRIAWAVAINMKKIGMHSTGKRLDLSKRHFISSTIENGKGIINKKLFEMFDRNFDLLVTQFSKDKNTKTIIEL